MTKQYFLFYMKCLPFPLFSANFCYLSSYLCKLETKPKSVYFNPVAVLACQKVISPPGINSNCYRLKKRYILRREIEKNETEWLFCHGKRHLNI